MKFGIRSAVNVVFKTTRSYTGLGDDVLLTPGRAWAEGEPVLYFDSLKTATTEGTAESVYARGGDGNPKLIAWEGDKEVTFTFEDALISTEGMSILTGAGLLEASVENKIRLHKKEIVDASIEDAATDIVVTIGEGLLDSETLVEAEAFGFVVDGGGQITTRLGAATAVTSGGEVTFDIEKLGLTKEEVTHVLVDYYVERGQGVQEISIEASKFAGSFYIEGETLFRRQSDGKDLAAQMIIPNAKIQTAFTFAMSPEGDPSTFTFTADAFPGTLKGGNSGKPTMYALRVLTE